MLVLSRRQDETICIGDDIVITVCHVSRRRVKLGIDAPRDIQVHREEIYEQVRQENLEAVRHADAAREALRKHRQKPEGDA